MWFEASAVGESSELAWTLTMGVDCSVVGCVVGIFTIFHKTVYVCHYYSEIGYN